MKEIGVMIASIIREPESEDVRTKVKRDVAELTAKFPMYPNRYKPDQIEAISAS